MKEIKHANYLLIVLILCLGFVSSPSETHAQCGSIPNGEMNGALNRRINGWSTQSGRIDLKSARTYTDLGPSPQGGNILTFASSGNESARIQTTISGLVVGKLYTLTWYTATTFNRPADSENSLGYFIEVGNKQKWHTTRPHSWNQESLVFIAGDKTEYFTLSLPLSSELLLDGLKISCGGSLEDCPTMTQGQMNGRVQGEPHGWTTQGRNVRLISHKDLPILGPSPQGGTLLMLKEKNSTSTRVETRLYGLNPGTTYTLSWYSAVEPGLYGSNNTKANYSLELGGNSSVYQSISSVWKQETVSFVASTSNPSVVVRLNPSSNLSSRMLLDGFNISCSLSCDLEIPRYSKN